ncbi:uncharacterized protein LOC141855555 [Brevipalpus obovatus]|uniref:uncharacterized protein LOC141855555 n=1 Tax=Brevipalpus obovatus TaxID=246614 RepID=UPI003D9DF682
MEWSKRSNQCPVCRTVFNSVIFNIKSDTEYESVPIERPRMAIIPIVNVFRDITVSPDGRNATVRTRYLTRDGIREITEVRDLNTLPSTSTSPPLAQIARENGLQSMVNSFLQDIAARNRELPQTERLPLPSIPHPRRPPMPDDDDDDDDDFVI